MRLKRDLSWVRRLVAGLAAATVVVCARGPLWELSKQLAVTAAEIQVPPVGTETGSEDPDPPVSSSGGADASSAANAETERSEPAASAVSEQTALCAISRRTVTAAAADTVYGGVALSNHTSEHTVNLASVLARAPRIDLVKNGRPQILIIHTHTSECYMTEESESCDPAYSGISSDQSRTVVAVGNVIAEKLEQAGIKVIHETTVFDTDFSSSYENAAKKIGEILKKYSSIEMVLDVHRDSMTSSGGTRTAPVAEINGKNAAQIMLLTGCNEDGALYFPTWEYNLRTAVCIQKTMSDMYPGLARPIYFTARRYNMQLTKNSLLVEIGTEVNTVEEAKYAGELFAAALIKTLENL